MDINKTTHIGTVVTEPSLITLGSGTPMAVFTLKCTETWKNKKGNQSRDNLIVFEALKDKAYWVKSNVHAGKRYVIDGTVRFDNFSSGESTRIRIFRIEATNSFEFSEGLNQGRKESLKKAMAIANTSDDLSIVQAKLEVLLAEL